MLSVEDQSILLDFEEEEQCNPSPCKVVENRVIYSSRKLGIPKVRGRPVLSDFGEARFKSRVDRYSLGGRTPINLPSPGSFIADAMQ